MAFLPSGVFDLLALALVLVGTAVVVAKRDVPKAYGLGFVILLVFALDYLARVVTGVPLAAELGFAPVLLREGAWWTPLTSMFVHADLFHVFGNLFILLTAGPSLEERVGDRRFLLIYFVAGLAAVAVHALLAYATPLFGPSSIAVGASGAIFGVLTAFAVRYPRDRLPMLLVFFVAWIPAFVVLLLYLAFNLAYLLGDWVGGAGGRIAWWGHFAGFLVGLAWAARLPAGRAAHGTAGLPDPAKLEPLATTPALRETLARIRQFTPDARTEHDATFVSAWLDKFFDAARCPQGHAFTRDGMTATCEGGETRIEFARGKR